MHKEMIFFFKKKIRKKFYFREGIHEYLKELEKKIV